jgi:hypothetical protein
LACQAEWRLNKLHLMLEKRHLTVLLASFSRKIDGGLSRVQPTFRGAAQARGLIITLDCEH